MDTQEYSDKSFTDKFIGKGSKDDDDIGFIQAQVSACVKKIMPIIRQYSNKQEFLTMLALKLVDRR